MPLISILQFAVSGAQLSLMQSQGEGIWRLFPACAAPAPQVCGVPENKSSTCLVCPLLMLFEAQSKCHQPSVMGSASELSSNSGLHQNVATVLVVCLWWKMEQPLLVMLLENFPPGGGGIKKTQLSHMHEVLSAYTIRSIYILGWDRGYISRMSLTSEQCHLFCFFSVSIPVRLLLEIVNFEFCCWEKVSDWCEPWTL